MTSLDTAGFTLNWTTNDGTATEIFYLAPSVKRRIVVTDRCPDPRRRRRVASSLQTFARGTPPS